MTSSARLALVLLLMLPASSPARAAPDDVRVTQVARLRFATGMEMTRSGERLFVNERNGDVRVLVRGALRGEPVATVPTTMQGEGGLLGLALHPRFEDGMPFLYVFATSRDGQTDRVIRMRVENDRAVEQREILSGLDAGFYHHGGILAFGPDGKLYVSHGESHQTSRAQNPRVLGGKIYRLNDDGSTPADNPFSGSRTFAYGIRNPFGLAFDPASGLLWETENGPQSNDEVNIIERGRNYGWPTARGDADDRRFVDPVRDYPRIIVPTMAAFGGDALPAPYRGNFFFGSYADRSIRRFELTANRRGIARESVFHRADDGVVGMTMGRDGLYFSTPSALFRIAPAAAASPGSASASPGSASASPSASGAASPPEAPAGSSRGVGLLLGLGAVIGLGLAGSIALMRMRR